MKYLTLNSKSLDPIEKSFVNLDMGTGNLFAISGKSDSGGGDIDLWNYGVTVRNREVEVDSSSVETVIKTPGDSITFKEWEITLHTKSFDGYLIMTSSVSDGSGATAPYIKFFNGGVEINDVMSGIMTTSISYNPTSGTVFHFDTKKSILTCDGIPVTDQENETFIITLNSIVTQLIVFNEQVIFMYQGSFGKIIEITARLKLGDYE